MTSCKYCREEIVPCPTPSTIPVCRGWKHVRFLDSMPIGAHYCEGRSVNPVAEPEIPVPSSLSSDRPSG